MVPQGDDIRVQLRQPVQFGSNDIPIEQFLTSVRFDHKSKLDPFEIKMGK